MPYHSSAKTTNTTRKKPIKKKNVGKKTPTGMHRMPDGSFMKGKKHSSKMKK